MVGFNPRRWWSRLTNRGKNRVADAAGGTHQSHAVLMETVQNQTATVGAAVGYVPARPWQDKWREALDAYDVLKAAYDGTGVPPKDSNGYKRMVTNFADACWEVKDHLADDKTSGVTKPVVEHYARNVAVALPIVADLTNVDKHGSPGKSATELAYIVGLHPHDGRVEMTVEYERGGTTSTTDALALATRALAEWRTFFATHSLTE